MRVISNFSLLATGSKVIDQRIHGRQVFFGQGSQWVASRGLERRSRAGEWAADACSDRRRRGFGVLDRGVDALVKRVDGGLQSPKGVDDLVLDGAFEDRADTVGDEG